MLLRGDHTQANADRSTEPCDCRGAALLGPSLPGLQPCAREHREGQNLHVNATEIYDSR
jgi:hypothetical protein